MTEEKTQKPDQQTTQFEKESHNRGLRHLAFVFLIAAAFVFTFFCINMISKKLIRIAGEPDASLNGTQKFLYSLRIAGRLDALNTPQSKLSDPILITIESGEYASATADKLETAGIIPDADDFLNYLLYKGRDQWIIPGKYIFSGDLSPIEIAAEITSYDGKLLTFAILSGMRLEEVAALIPTSGLSFTEEEFLTAAKNYPSANHPTGGTSLEGYLLPGIYEMNRNISLKDFLNGFVEEFNNSITLEMRNAYTKERITLEQAVITASMIAREAMSPSEYGLIASVFLNRFYAGMPFESDPTAQYAIGWDPDSHSWWKMPLTASDISINSPYNTYKVSGFPPGPICSPSLDILKAVAAPEETSYFYFRAKCDGTPYHNFSGTYAEHAANACK